MNKSYVIRTRLSEKEYQEVSASAKKAGLSLSAFIRKSIFEKEIVIRDRESIIIMKKTGALLNQLIYEIHKIGTNINQIVHNYNSEFYSERDKANLIQLLDKIIDIVNKLYSDVKSCLSENK